MANWNIDKITNDMNNDAANAAEQFGWEYADGDTASWDEINYTYYNKVWFRDITPLPEAEKLNIGSAKLFRETLNRNLSRIDNYASGIEENVEALNKSLAIVAKTGLSSDLINDKGYVTAKNYKTQILSLEGVTPNPPVEDFSYADYSFRYDIEFPECTAEMVPTIIFSQWQALSQNYSMFCMSDSGKVSFWSKTDEPFTEPIPLITLLEIQNTGFDTP